jgi:hypothetical protein
MREFFQSPRNLGLATLVVCCSAVLLRLTHVTEGGPPLEVIAVTGIFLLLRPQSALFGARILALASGLVSVWSIICILVLMFAHPAPFASPAVLFGYLVGSGALACWGLVVARHVGRIAGRESKVGAEAR